MINNTIAEISAAIIVLVAVGALIANPPNPRPKPEPEPPEEQSPIVEFQAVPTMTAHPQTRQEKVDELARKLSIAEDDLADIAATIERLKAEKQAKDLDKSESKDKQ